MRIFTKDNGQAASKAAVTDAMRWFAEEALKTTGQDQSLGLVPPVTSGELLKGAGDVARGTRQSRSDQGQLAGFAERGAGRSADRVAADSDAGGPQVRPARADQVGGRQADQAGGEAGLGEPRQAEADRAAQGVEPPDLAKKKWKANPKRDAYDKAAWTNRLSRYEDVFVAAGHDPGDVSLYPPERQFNIAARQTESAFGIAKIEKTPKAQSRHAIDQLKDAYRSMGHMAEVIGFNPTAIGLDGHFGIILRKLGRGEEAYYGAFYRKGTPSMEGLPGSRDPKIVLPERTNSFGHEWAHALDHWVNEKLGLSDMPGMLSEHVKKLKDRTFKQGSFFTPELTDVARAMGQVYEAMTIGADGNPTQFAIESLDYGQAHGGKKGAAYYGSAREMLARSF